MRGGWLIAAGIVAGLVVLLVAGALIGGDDDSDETVSALEWADNVCGAVAVWRGEMESIVDGVRSAGQSGTAGSESGAETPQGQSGSVRTGLEQALLATETMVEGISRAGIPDTPNGQDAADGLESWADDAVDEIEQAQDSWVRTRSRQATRSRSSTEGVRTIVEVYAAGGESRGRRGGRRPGARGGAR